MAGETTQKIEMPDISTLTKLYFAETKTGERKQICFTEELPAIEEAPEPITGSAVDIDYEFSRPGKVKAGTIEVPVYYTYTQHKWLKSIERKEGYFFEQYPENTAPDGENPLIKMFQGSLVVVGDAITVDEFLKDKVTIYRTTKPEEMYEFPTA